ncbi:unnamed protein product [Allacma fusca]|uniref:Uncharacterized protein n=1 Tax=Allacma fusca TaxID=39272 RepID=A0A8J2JN83_9HEXA|nr:unnamed protein product [Allacma fusca]
MLRPWKLFVILLSASVVLLICYFVFLTSQDSLIYTLAESSQLSNEIISLGKLNIIEDQITLSGFSAGASMATQFHIAYSSLFSGVAIFSQVFYRCGPGSVIEFGIRCSKYVPLWFPYKVESSVADARSYEENQLIDPLENLKRQRVFIWTGALDEYIPLELAKQNKDFYDNFIPNHHEQISLNVESEAKHLFVSEILLRFFNFLYINFIQNSSVIKVHL